MIQISQRDKWGLAILLLSSFAYPLVASAQMPPMSLDQGTPDVLYNGSPFYLTTFIRKDFRHANYDRFELYTFASLPDQLYALPHNQARYGSAAELAEAWHVLVQNTGLVYHGWHPAPQGYDPLMIEHDPMGYSAWQAGDMDLGLYLPASQLDGNGDGWNNGPDDYRIVFGDPLDVGGIAIGVDGSRYPISALSYRVVPVPEPTAALLVLPSAFLLLRRRSS